VKSVVAGIVNKDGGLRVVVTKAWRLRHHVQKGERLYIVPGLKVKEPVPFGQAQAAVIAAARKYVLSQIAPVNHCGECKACCVTPYVSEDGLHKPSHTPCHNLCAEGCGRYWKRPTPCQVFQCKWLKSQRTEAPMAAELRPDKCGVILTADTSAYIGGTPDAELIEAHYERGREPSAEIAAYLSNKKVKTVTHYWGEE
jgi:hypothetical protein